MTIERRTAHVAHVAHVAHGIMASIVSAGTDPEGWQLPMYRLTVVYDEPADKEAFDRRYADEHVPLVKAVPGLGSFQLSHPQGGTPYLVAELFWPNEDAFKASAATPEMAETRKHAEGCGTTFTVYTGDVTEV